MTKFAWFSVVCLQTLHLALCPTDPQMKPVKLGEDVILQCQDPRNDTIELVEWIRPDLQSEGYVLYFRDGHTYENYQHPSFYDRVELRDPGMKNGDVSVILRNVTINDLGKYECHVRNNKDSTHEFTITIVLTLTDSGGGAGRTEDGGHVGLIVGVTVVFVLLLLLLLLLVLGCFVRHRKRKALKKQNQSLARKRGDDERHMLNDSVGDSLDAVSVMTHPDQNQSY